MPNGTGSTLRKAVVALGAAESLAILVFVVVMLQSSDPLGKAIGQGMAQLAAVPFVVCILPGLALGIVNRWHPAALLLLVLAVPVGFVLWRFA